MITKIRQIQLKVQKFNELMVKLKSKYLDKPDVYADLHKLDLKCNVSDFFPQYTFTDPLISIPSLSLSTFL